MLLQTKLFIPPFRPSQILRPRLVNKLNDTRPCKLILLSAPAGYGKTTLVTEWLAQLEANTAVCWLSLDEDDNDTQRFFSYIAAAVQPLTGTQTSLTQQLQAPQPLPRQTTHGRSCQ
jgi:LuxR family maltose regulon positive regulatory protein